MKQVLTSSRFDSDEPFSSIVSSQYCRKIFGLRIKLYSQSRGDLSQANTLSWMSKQYGMSSIPPFALKAIDLLDLNP